LIRRIADEDPWNPAGATAARKEQLARAHARVVDFEVPSPKRIFEAPRID
jgi:hypothetical protein